MSMDTKDEDSPAAVERRDPDEIEAAILALSEADRLRLEKYGRLRIKQLGPAAHGRTWLELYDEAVVATLDDERRTWPDDVDFVRHLHMTMRSIADSWQKRHKRRADAGWEEVDSISGTPRDGEGEVDHLSQLEDDRAGADVQLAMKGLFEAVADTFADDRIVLGVVECVEAGLKGPETQELLDISVKEYRAAVRRLRYWWENTGKDDHHVN